MMDSIVIAVFIGILVLLGLIVYLVGGIALTTLYILQIKEYRFDRLWSQIKEDGFLGLYRKNFGKSPAASTRNLLVIFIAIILFFASVYSLFNLTNNQFSDYPNYNNCVTDNSVPTATPGNTNTIRVCESDLVFRIPSFQSILLYCVKLTIFMVIINPILAALSVMEGVLITEPFSRYKRNKLIRQALAKVKESKAVFIGISGTYGKSTTKEYLFHILSQKFRVGKTDENMNTDVGVAVSILKNLKQDTQYFVAEVGAYKLGEVKRAVEIFNPWYAIMLPFGNQHIDLYGSKENLVAGESEILDFIPQSGRAYACADIPELAYVKKRTKSPVTTYSATQKADISATDIKTTEKGSRAVVNYNEHSFFIETTLLGKHVIQNLLPAIAVAMDLGMTPAEVATAIASLEQVPGKLSIHNGKNNAVILNDTGNSSVNGFLAAIDTIRLFKKPYTYILSKGIIELGKEKEKSYKEIIIHIDKDNIQLATSDKLFKKVKGKNSITIVRSERDFETYIVPKLGPQTAVLLEGKFTRKFIEKFI